MENSVTASPYQMSKFRTAMFVVAIFLSSIAIMGDAAPGVIYNDIYEAYPNDIGVVNAIISMPQIMIILGSLLATVLLRFLSKKALLIIGIAIFGVGGVLGAAVDNVYFMLAMRIPYGLGMAFINVVGVAFLAEVFVDEGKRATIVGMYNAVMALLGSALSIVAGQMALSGWRTVFQSFWISAVILVLFVFFLPGRPAAGDESGAEKAEKGAKEPLGARFWAFTVVFALFDMFFCVFTFYISTYVAENAMGDASFSALLISAYTLGGFAGGMLFGIIYRFVKRYSAVLAYVLGAACMVLLWTVPPGGVALALSFALGATYSIALTYAYSHIPSIVPASRMDDCIGIVTAAYGLGSAVATYFTTWVMGFFGGFEVTPVILVAGVLMVACMAAELAFVRLLEKPSSEAAGA